MSATSRPATREERFRAADRQLAQLEIGEEAAAEAIRVALLCGASDSEVKLLEDKWASLYSQRKDQGDVVRRMVRRMAGES